MKVESERERERETERERERDKHRYIDKEQKNKCWTESKKIQISFYLNNRL